MESLSQTSWRYDELTTISQETDPIRLVLTGDIARSFLKSRIFKCCLPRRFWQEKQFLLLKYTMWQIQWERAVLGKIYTEQQGS